MEVFCVNYAVLWQSLQKITRFLGDAYDNQEVKKTGLSTFIREVDRVDEVDASEHSDYDKLIIIMTVVNIPPGEIANLIESNPQSIKKVVNPW